MCMCVILHLFYHALLLHRAEAAVPVLVQARAADGGLVRRAVELAQLRVLRAEAMPQVRERGLREAVCAVHGVLAVRPHVLGAEGCGASHACALRLRDHARVTQHRLGLGFGLGFGFGLGLRAHSGCVAHGPDGVRHGAQHGVPAQLGPGGVHSAALRAAHRSRLTPRGLQTRLAETVAACETHRPVERTQTDAAREVLLQGQQGRRHARTEETQDTS